MPILDIRARRAPGPARLAALLLLALGLSHCGKSGVYDPKPPDAAKFTVSHLGTYSSKLDEEKEIPGTIFETKLSFEMAREGSGWKLTRKLDTLKARGYHKVSMPHELEKKIDLVIHLDSAMIPTRFEGYDSLKPVLGRIQQKEEFRKALLASSDPAVYQAEWRDWWRMKKLLPIGVELKYLQPLDPAAVNQTLETMKIDSARYDGIRPRLKKSCLDYSLFYHRTDSLALLMEQFYFSNIQNRKYRKYSWGPTVVKGVLQFSVEKSTGLPCFHARTEYADLDLELKAEKLRTPVHLYRYEEDIYDYR